MRIDLKSRLRRFRRDSGGSSQMVELMFSLPFLIWGVLAIIVFFYGFEMRTKNIKGSYTLSDMLSREQDGPLTPKYIEGLDDVFAYLTDTPDDGSRIRVTVIHCSNNCDPDTANGARELDINWSWATGGLKKMHEDALDTHYDQHIPIVPPNETAILVETQVYFRPPMNYALKPMIMESFVVTRPRFVSELKWNETGEEGES